MQFQSPNSKIVEKRNVVVHGDNDTRFKLDIDSLTCPNKKIKSLTNLYYGGILAFHPTCFLTLNFI